MRTLALAIAPCPVARGGVGVFAVYCDPRGAPDSALWAGYGLSHKRDQLNRKKDPGQQIGPGRDNGLDRSGGGEDPST